MNEQDLADVDATRTQRRRIGNEGRVDPGDPARLAAQVLKGRGQEFEFTDAGRFQHELHEARFRPSIARQVYVQGGKPAGRGGKGLRSAKLTGTPKVGVLQQVLYGHLVRQRILYLYTGVDQVTCMFIQYQAQ